MKLFNDGAEIRLTKEDLSLLLQEALNVRFFALSTGSQKVINLTLHPNNKYVARVTIKNIKPPH